MIKKYILDNGLRIVTEKIEYVKSVSFGIWVKVGSINENADTNGLSHLIEHMLFKGTEKRTANQIAEETDNIGGQLNAFTANDCTCYYIKVLDENLDEAVDILTDMFLNSKMSPDELKKELSVVLEEIKMYEDSPEDVVHDTTFEVVFKDSPLAYPILGTKNKIKTYTSKDIIEYKNNQYSPYNTVISVAGNFDEEYLLNLLTEKFSQWEGNKPNPINLQCNYQRQIVGVNKDLEQLHFCLSNKTVGKNSELYYPLMVMNNILGETASSRLFQEVREKRGIVYSIYSFITSFSETGLFGVYAGLAYKNLNKTIEIILDEMNDMKNMNITEKEFYRAKQQIKSDYLLGLESTSNRMSSIGRRESLYNEILTPEEIVEKINAVKMEDILKISDMVFNPKDFSVVYTGNLKKHKDIQKVFEKLLK